MFCRTRLPALPAWLSLAAGLALSAGAASAAAPDVAALLVAADRYRTGSDNLQVDTLVTTLGADGAAEKERRYTVFAQAQHRSLVLMRSPAEAGQKVLMLGDDFWLLMPASQRPLRITPSQKLLGDAATGDIATMSWRDDYQARVVGEERCPLGDGTSNNNAPCWHLHLEAQRKGVSYQRIELWVGKAKQEPIKAELYVQSDKLAKEARFVIDPKQPQWVSEMVLADKLSNHKETRVRYLSRTPRQIPQTWLNPMFLVRNPALD